MSVILRSCTALWLCTLCAVALAHSGVEVARQLGWKANFGGNFYCSCAFRPERKYVQLMVDVRRNNPGLSGWNEIMVNTWPQNIAHKLPLEAFFYSLNSHYKPNGIGGLAGGQGFQRDYLQQTGRTLALITLDVLASDGQPFSFDPNAQALW